jgi:hypothetical protein
MLTSTSYTPLDIQILNYDHKINTIHLKLRELLSFPNNI